MYERMAVIGCGDKRGGAKFVTCIVIGWTFEVVFGIVSGSEKVVSG